jgi:uncharacterized membrane protein
MNEFLTSFSSDQSALWAVFVLGVVIATALGLSLFWSAIFRLGSMIISFTKKTPPDQRDVLP